MKSPKMRTKAVVPTLSQYIMSREKPDRATCIYVPEPDGPVTWSCGDVVAVRMKDDPLWREKKKKITVY